MSSLLSSVRICLSRTRPTLPSTLALTDITCPVAISSHASSLSSSPPVRHARVIVQKRAKEGLYAGKHIQFGNSVSHSHHKTRRTWQPNAQRAFLFSHILQQSIPLHCTTHALRCIDKAGGLDAYIMGQDSRRLVGKAKKLRERLEAVHRPVRLKAEIEERLRRRAEKSAAQNGGQSGVTGDSSGVAASDATSAHIATNAA